MVYAEFSTEKAHYVFQANNHSSKNTQNVFEGIDALVIETGYTTLSQIVTEYHPQMAMPVDHCKKNHIPVFGADVQPTKYGDRRDDLSEVLRYFVTFPVLLIAEIAVGLHYGFSKKKVDGGLSKVYSDYLFVLQEPVVEGRNAINARKIEEFIAPMVAEASGKKKPKIGLVYGAGHLGLRYDIQSKRRRDFTIWNWRNLNIKKYAGFGREELGKVHEARHHGNLWQFKEYETRLFN